MIGRTSFSIVKRVLPVKLGTRKEACVPHALHAYPIPPPLERECLRYDRRSARRARKPMRARDPYGADRGLRASARGSGDTRKGDRHIDAGPLQGAKGHLSRRFFANHAFKRDGLGVDAAETDLCLGAIDDKSAPIHGRRAAKGGDIRPYEPCGQRLRRAQGKPSLV